jgi:hypothetical protein
LRIDRLERVLLHPFDGTEVVEPVAEIGKSCSSPPTVSSLLSPAVDLVIDVASVAAVDLRRELRALGGDPAVMSTVSVTDATRSSTSIFTV